MSFSLMFINENKTKQYKMDYVLLKISLLVLDKISLAIVILIFYTCLNSNNQYRPIALILFSGENL